MWHVGMNAKSRAWVEARAKERMVENDIACDCGWTPGLGHAEDCAVECAWEDYCYMEAEALMTCPTCGGETSTEGTVGHADVELVCRSCDGRGELGEEEYGTVCDDEGYCRGCGEEVCNAGCSEDEHADMLFHEDR